MGRGRWSRVEGANEYQEMGVGRLKAWNKAVTNDGGDDARADVQAKGS